MPNLELEAVSEAPVAGVDEAGRGPWAGPVVAAAVILDPENIPAKINDSKKLKPAQREALYTEIMARAISVGVGLASVEEIDAMNILAATKCAMQRAVAQLTLMPHTVLVDGNQPPKLAMPARAVIKGDSLSLSIAAASIIAKVTRDRIMEKLARDYPQYAWEKNMGYGTAAHQAGIEAHGVTPHHRKSFRPVREWLEGRGS